MKKIEVVWIDGKREPTQPPNPKFPDGVSLDLSSNATPTCVVALPYPAKRCGLYHVHCNVCGFNIAITTAGRPDDPCSARLPCKRPLN